MATAEFLVEPFVEGAPGNHVQAALDAFAGLGLDVDLGPFASTANGDIDQIAKAVAEMIRSSFSAGATVIRLAIGDGDKQLGFDSLHDALDSLVRSTERELGAPSDSWSREQKQAAVRILDERGAFLLRGAVDDMASIMGVSRITIYNYLNALNPVTDS